ncbi:LCP family glycopolymer transferase [Amedibacillus sp. YH-ame6]
MSLLLSICLAVLSIFVYQGDSFLSGFGMKYDVHSVSVIVMNESEFNDIKDLENKNFGTVVKTGGVIIANAVENIEKELSLSITIKSADSALDLTQQLYDGKIDAIILNESNRTIIKEKYKDFNSKTKIIYKTEIKKEIENANDVDITKETISVFISGNDMFDDSEEESERSDVNIIATINPTTKQVLITSVPRDSYVTLASYGGLDKLTHASIYGLDESVATLGKFFNVEIDNYFRINFSSLVRIVDALGGVTVENPVAFTNSYEASSGFGIHNFPVGSLDLSGKKALIYSRERKVFEDGDNMRGRNQQRVLSAIINKATSPAIITRYSGLLQSLEGSFETNLTDKQIKSFIQMQLGDMAKWDIQSAQLLVTEGMSTECFSAPGQELYVSYPVQESVDYISSLIHKMENNEKIVATETADTDTVFKN